MERREFEQLVLDSKPRVAVFDCDGTIWSGDSGYGFMIWTIEQGLVSRSTSDWIDTRHRAYLAGQVTELQICGEMVQMYCRPARAGAARGGSSLCNRIRAAACVCRDRIVARIAA